MLRDEYYTELYPKYAPKFERHGLDFNKGFHDLFDKTHATADTPLKKALEQSLDAILQAYIDSKPKTKAGRWARIGAKIGQFFLPLINYLKQNESKN